MVTNRVYVNNRGAGRDDVFSELERFAEYLKLSGKSRLHIRLLSEETLGMVSQIGGDFDAEFWIEYENCTCRICLEAELSEISSQKREELLKASTSGKNASAKGIMGKIKNVMELYWLGYKEGVTPSVPIDYLSYASLSMPTSSAFIASTWNLSDYKDSVEQQKDSDRIEEWDELERSIVANLADDVSVGIKGETVELVITKALKE